MCLVLRYVLMLLKQNFPFILILITRNFNKSAPIVMTYEIVVL